MKHDLTQAVNLLKELEGIKDGDNTVPGLQPYQCLAGKWTIGYGHVLTDADKLKAKFGPTKPMNQAVANSICKAMYPNGMTIKDAEILLKHDVEDFARRLNGLSDRESVDGRNMNLDDCVECHEFCAIVSLFYNAGVGAFGKSTMLKLINDNASKENISNQFARWNKAVVNDVQQVVPGLVTRRKKEKALFLNQEYVPGE